MMRAVVCILLYALITAPAHAADKKVHIVVSFSILKDIVSKVAKNQANVVSIVGPNQDTHIFEPTPETNKLILQADIVIINGLGFEKWIERVINASGYKGLVVVASQGIDAITLNQAQSSKKHLSDPHVWNSVANVKVWVRNIESALASIDFKNAKIYQKNAQDYLRELDRLDNWIKSQFQHISSEDRKIITAHDAFGYYGKAYGIKFLSPMGLTTETEPSAFAIAELIKQIRRENFSTLFVENMTNDRLMQQIAKETGIRIGGILYSDALSPIGEAGSTYIKMMEHNTNLFKAAMN